jgi:hypothetical protein
LHTDNGGEFTVTELADYCVDEGVRRHFSAPHSPQQNGVVERRNQTVVATARALLKQRRMPTKYWGEAVVTAVHLLNRSPTKSLLGKTPYEAWHGRAPSMSHLKVFGCVTYVKDLGQLRKLDDRGKSGIFIGYAEGAKAYRILDPATQRVKVSRDVVFDESRGWDWSSPAAGSSTAASNDFTVEYWTTGGEEGAQSASPSMGGAASPSPPAPGEPEQSAAVSLASSALGSSSPTHVLQSSTPPAPTPPASAGSASPASPTPSPAEAEDGNHVEFATPLDDDEDRLDAYRDDEPLRYRAVGNLIGSAPTSEPPPRLFAEVHLTNARETASYA